MSYQVHRELKAFPSRPIPDKTKESRLHIDPYFRLSELSAGTRIAGTIWAGKEWTLSSGDQTTDVVDIAYKILAYLRENPEAQDTLEGIVEWWLLDRRIRDQTNTVTEALDYLTKRGLVTARIGTDSRAHYAVERGRQQDIESLLKNRAG